MTIAAPAGPPIMGLIHIEMFATLDLVAQAPGGPDEDPAGGFAFGGWQAPLIDDVTGAQIVAAYEGTDALLLGRRTYDIFAAFWPHQEGGQDDDIATLFNRVGMPSFVVTLAGLLALLGLQLYLLGSTGSINLPFSLALVRFGPNAYMPNWLSFILALIPGAVILVSPVV